MTYSRPLSILAVIILLVVAVYSGWSGGDAYRRKIISSTATAVEQQNGTPKASSTRFSSTLFQNGSMSTPTMSTTSDTSGTANPEEGPSLFVSPSPAPDLTRAPTDASETLKFPYGVFPASCPAEHDFFEEWVAAEDSIIANRHDSASETDLEEATSSKGAKGRRKTWIVVDVGANKGYSILEALRTLLGPRLTGDLQLTGRSLFEHWLEQAKDSLPDGPHDLCGACCDCFPDKNMKFEFSMSNFVNPVHNLRRYLPVHATPARGQSPPRMGAEEWRRKLKPVIDMVFNGEEAKKQKNTTNTRSSKRQETDVGGKASRERLLDAPPLDFQIHAFEAQPRTASGLREFFSKRLGRYNDSRHSVIVHPYAASRKAGNALFPKLQVGNEQGSLASATEKRSRSRPFVNVSVVTLDGFFGLDDTASSSNGEASRGLGAASSENNKDTTGPSSSASSSDNIQEVDNSSTYSVRSSAGSLRSATPVDHIDLLLTDTEGFDHEVALGATRFLREQRVELYVFEATLSKKLHAPWLANYTQWLESVGYRCWFPMEKQRRRVSRESLDTFPVFIGRLVRITHGGWRKGYEYYVGWSNVVCCRDENPVLRRILDHYEKKVPVANSLMMQCNGAHDQAERAERQKERLYVAYLARKKRSAASTTTSPTPPPPDPTGGP